jgi:CDP-paratose 2-epimerase
VRDVLFVEDLLDAMLLATGPHRRAVRQAFNMGGGPASTVSLLELLEMIGELGTRRRCASATGAWATSATTSPTPGASRGDRLGAACHPREGVALLHEWLSLAPGGSSRLTGSKAS